MVEVFGLWVSSLLGLGLNLDLILVGVLFARGWVRARERKPRSHCTHSVLNPTPQTPNITPNTQTSNPFSLVFSSTQIQLVQTGPSHEKTGSSKDLIGLDRTYQVMTLGLRFRIWIVGLPIWDQVLRLLGLGLGLGLGFVALRFNVHCLQFCSMKHEVSQVRYTDSQVCRS